MGKKCIYDNCDITPSFNYYIGLTPIFCFKHKKENMINLTSRKCVYYGCNTNCSYNYQGIKKPIFCFKHKRENMINTFKNFNLEENAVEMLIKLSNILEKNL